MPGDGDLDIRTFVDAALDAGYAGAFEFEMVGPRSKPKVTPPRRRAVDRADALLEEVLS